MKDKCFFDTNILIYLYSEDSLNKKEIVLSKFDNYQPVISTQVINEFSNVLIKKFGINENQIKNALEELSDNFVIRVVDLDSIYLALDLRAEFKYSFYDCLILSSSLKSDCEVLFSEDFHHNQLILNKTRIVNPFLN